MGAIKKLTEMMERMDINDKYYNRKYQDMQDRMDILYFRCFTRVLRMIQFGCSTKQQSIRYVF